MRRPVKLFPDLHNIEDFHTGDHPKIWPGLPEYEMYWEEQTRKSIEGMWGEDRDKKTGAGGFRWMPGPLYFYINMLDIKRDDDEVSEVTMKPLLRDIDWIMFYDLAVCDKFSGFEDDDKYTSFLPVKFKQEGKELSPKHKIWFETYEDYLRDKNGKLKTYVDPLEYLFKTHDSPKGRPLYLNECLNYPLVGTRSFGKSYGLAALLCHEFTLDGAQSFDTFLQKDLSSTIFVGAIDDSYSTETLDKFEHMYYQNIKTLGGWEYDDPHIDAEPGYWFHPTIGTLSSQGKPLKKQYRTASGQGYHGNNTQLVHKTFGGKRTEAAVSYRAKKVLVEESGLLGEYFDAIYQSTEATKERERKMGFTANIGTGGNMEKVKGFKSMYYNPKAYKALAIPNKFGAKGFTGRFIPAYYRKAMFKTEMGNTRLEEAFEQEMIDRQDLLNDKGAKAVQKHAMSFPIDEKEVFMETGDNPFPTDRASVRLMELEEGGWKESRTVGNISWIDKTNKVSHFFPDMRQELTPIAKMGDENDRNDLTGAFVMYEAPIDPLPKASFKNPLYMTYYDPVKDEEGTSVCVAFVMKFWDFDNPRKLQFNIAAEWIGRTPTLEGNHEQVFKLASLYNSKIMAEMNNADIKRYAMQTGRFDMLQPRPAETLDENFKQKKNYDVGAYISPGMIPTLNIYTNELLRQNVNVEESIIGNELIRKEIQFVDQLTSIRACEEVIAYRDDGNFDYVSALRLLAIWVRQFRYYESQAVNEPEEEKALSSLKQHMQQQWEETTPNPAFNY